MALEPVYRAHYVEHLEAEIVRLRAALDRIRLTEGGPRSVDADRRLELIALLAQDQAWDAVVLIGKELLDTYYPADIFTGVSGGIGPLYIVALRDALNRITK